MNKNGLLTGRVNMGQDTKLPRKPINEHETQLGQPRTLNSEHWWDDPGTLNQRSHKKL